MLTGLKDVDREILKHVDDRELLKVCTIDRKTWNEVCDDDFLKRRLTLKYPDIEKYKKENESWKRFFLKFLYYTSLMRDKYKFEYQDGNFEKQYELFEKYYNDDPRRDRKQRRVNPKNKNNLLIYAAENGELPVVKFALAKKAQIYAHEDYALRSASENGHLDVVKFLIEHGADIHAREDYALIAASENGHLEIVKYLVEHGADIDESGDIALQLARENGHSEVANYLESLR